jgi:polyvinyl alcohol dehydrogenase (cytochrome)
VPFDAWIVSCIPGFDVFGGAACPQPAGPDYDFGQGPMLFTVKTPGNRSRDLLGAGQKSGQYWALDPDDGSVVWVTQSGPGGTGGGLQWGSATDGQRIFTANANSDHKTWDLVPFGGVTNGGIWSALDAASGQIIWQVANTNPDPNPLGVLPPGLRAGSNAPVTVANGVVYGCSLDPQGHMYAFDAATGAQLWEFHAPDSGSCAAGPAVVQGTVYWGSGYGGFFGASGHKMRAFKLP